MASRGLIHGQLGENSVHVCVDMQRLFEPGAPWAMPWMENVLPAIVELVASHAERTVFTRFIPAVRAEEALGMWAAYYRKWENLTLSQIDKELLELVPELRRFAPPAKVIDKSVYSPWTEGALDTLLTGSGVDTIVITGGETDVCVLATALGAVDRGFRLVIVTDAVCSSADATHDAIMELYRTRFSEQVEAVTMQEVLAAWR